MGDGAEYYLETKALHLRRLLGSNFQGELLDFGCGIGLLSRQLVRWLPGARLNGFDVSTESVSRVDLPGRFFSDPSQLGHGYPAIVISNVLHHVAPPERRELMRDLGERLAPGGRLVLYEHNPFNPLTRLVVSRCPLDENAILLPPNEACGYFSSLRVERLDFLLFFPKSLAWFRPLERYLAWLPLGAQYSVVGRREP
ncbi:MAG: class I SAM-dependent methyltransferase [Candidatus Eremiobacterota bacterium]